MQWDRSLLSSMQKMNTSTQLQTSSSPITSSNQTTAKQPTQESTQATAHSQTRKTPLLPTLTMTAQQHMTRTLISGPLQQNSNRYKHNPYFPRPQNAPISQTMTTTTSITIKSDTSTFKTIPTHTRTLHTASIYIHTSFTTVPESSHHLITGHACSIKTQSLVTEKDILHT